jgi:hypothetical protein
MHKSKGNDAESWVKIRCDAVFIICSLFASFHYLFLFLPVLMLSASGESIVCVCDVKKTRKVVRGL